VSEKSSLQKMFVPKTEEMSGYWKNLHNDDGHILKIVQFKLGGNVKENEKAGHAVGVTEISSM
jgi:hypothetical protein